MLKIEDIGYYAFIVALAQTWIEALLFTIAFITYYAKDRKEQEDEGERSQTQE